MADKQTNDDLAAYVIGREERLRASRNELEQTWDEIAKYCLPRKATFLERAPTGAGVDRNRTVLDSTAARSLELFASFLHTMNNNPSAQWFLVEDEDAEINEDQEARDWFEKVSRITRSEFASEKANVYGNLHETYLDTGAFGTAILFSDYPDRLRVRSFHLADCVIDENSHGFIDTVFRRARFTPRQAEQKFGDLNVDATRRSDAKDIEYIHAVFPVTDADASSLINPLIERAGFTFTSIWIDTETREVIEQSGYREFPYAVPRWYRVRDDMYGRSPAMTVMPDVRMANRMKETILRGAEKLVDPPLLMPEGGLVSPVRLMPGGLTFTDGQVKPEPLIPPGASRIEMGQELLSRTQDAIRDGFFNPLFVTPDSPVKTATQVLQQVDERNRAVSPMLVRQQTELYHPFIKRAINLLNRAGKFPERPGILIGRPLTVRYVSPLASSQLQLEALGTQRIIEGLLPWANVDPTVLDPFDPDEVAKVVQAGSGAPTKILRSKSALAKLRADRADAAQQQQLTENMVDATGATAKMVAATTNPGER
jgi:hypothetical protein